MLHCSLGFHHKHFTLALGYQIDYFPAEISRHINNQRFKGLTFFTVDSFYQNLRLTNG